MAEAEPKPPEIIEVPKDIKPANRKGKSKEYLDEIRKKRTGAYRKAEEVTMAILDCGGDRHEAAKKLGMKYNYLLWRISTNPTLKARFGINAQKILAETEFGKTLKFEPPDKTISILRMKLEELVVGQAVLASFTMSRLTEVRERMSNGNKAKLLMRRSESKWSEEDREFIQQWKFEDRDEEKLLAQQEEYLLREFTHGHSTVVETHLRKAKVDQIIKSIRGKGALDQPKPNRPVAPPKGAALAVTNCASMVNPPTEEHAAS